ncbi:MAG: hypothetical protein RL021_1037, partial [Bacteroidota bacterium]
MEKEAGLAAYYSDEQYVNAGATLTTDSKELLSKADVVLKVNAPTEQEVSCMKKGAVIISFLYAATNPSLIEACQRQGISAFSMDAIPRISRAQKMDAL